MSKFLPGRFGFMAILSSIAALCGGACFAQESFRPQRPIRIVVPYNPGGSVDAQARLLAEKLRVRYGQPVVVDNKPGATGIIGAQDVARARPDGLTLLLTNTAVVQAPLTNAALKFDPLKDLVPIAQVSLPQTLFVVDSRLPYTTLADFIHAAKTPGADFSYGSAGYGQSLHLFGVKLNRAAGIGMLHVPFSGEAQVVNALLGHQVSAAFLTVNASGPHIRSGSLRPLAALSTARLPRLPRLPTFAEEGVPGMDLVTFVGVFAPRGLPRDLQRTLNRDIASALASDDIRQRFDALDINPGLPLDETAFTGFVRQQYAAWKDLVTQEDIHGDVSPSSK